MSKTVSFEIPDEIYELLQTVAVQMGRSTEEVALEWLVRLAPKPRPQLTSEEREAAEQRFRRRCGAVDSGNPRSADNEQIDADLVCEYGSNHEDATNIS